LRKSLIFNDLRLSASGYSKFRAKITLAGTMPTSARGVKAFAIEFRHTVRPFDIMAIPPPEDSPLRFDNVRKLRGNLREGRLIEPLPLGAVPRTATHKVHGFRVLWNVEDDVFVFHGVNVTDFADLSRGEVIFFYFFLLGQLPA